MSKTFRKQTALQILKTARVVQATGRQRDASDKLKTVPLAGCFALETDLYPEANFSVVYFPTCQELRIVSRWGLKTWAELECNEAAAVIGDRLHAELKAAQA